MAMPSAEGLARFQQPRRPAEALAPIRTPQPAPLTSNGRQDDSTRALLETLVAKLDGLADRPIDVRVTTQLDGRRIAEAVYKDLREQRVRNYETF